MNQCPLTGEARWTQNSIVPNGLTGMARHRVASESWGLGMDVVINIARHHLRTYADESEKLMVDHQDAMECRDCEETLKAGILAYKWLKSADEVFREADYQGLKEYSEKRQKRIFNMFRKWLKRCRSVETWIERLRVRDYEPDNLAEFRNTCEEVEETVRQLEWQKGVAQARLNSEAEEDRE